jgi:predicted N-formylglutamate amidohydrolase
LVGHDGDIAVSELPFRILGEPRRDGILIVGDHASNRVPSGLDLGIEPSLLEDHIAWDIGVAAVSAQMVETANFAAYLGNISRLVVDLNRNADEAAVVPAHSDGVHIAGNQLDRAAHASRLQAYHHPYHQRLERVLAEKRPALILSLHSFTPQLQSRRGVVRAWELGVLYNEQEAPSKVAIGYLELQGLNVGDQLPYSGKQLNATMNRHAEANNIPYVGIEMRQDLVSDLAGQQRLAHILSDMSHFVSEKLGLTTQNP